VVQIDAALNSGASGGAAVVEGELAGVNFQGIDEADNVGYIIPVSVIEQFLEDAEDGRVDGVPILPIRTQPIASEPHRNYKRLSDEQTGVEIVSLPPFVEELQVGDIVTAVVGEDIGGDGSVRFGKGDRVPFQYLVAQRQFGDTIDLNVIRNGEALKAHVVLRQRMLNAYPVTRPHSGFVPPYAVINGLVFQELSSSYVSEVFEEGATPTWMTEYARRLDPTLSGETGYVFFGSVLPHPSNRGMEVFEDELVTTVNGLPIKNLSHFLQMLRKSREGFVRIEFEEGRYLVLDRKAIESNDEAIGAMYELQ
jgi:hypothetical protein